MKNLQMTSYWLCLSLMISISTLQGQMAVPLSEQDTRMIASKASALLDQYVEFGDFAGVSAGILYHGEVLWKGGAGYRDLERKKTADSEMLHRIASISKPMTAIAVLQLVEKGLIDLDAPIQQYLPDYPPHAEGDITIRHLLNHTSGIKAYPNKRESFSSTHYASLKEALNLFKDRPLNHFPGTAYLYTTYGYTVLGAIIEKVSGLNYDEYMKKNIWAPAGMTKTGLEIFGKQYSNKASLYKKNQKGEFVADKQTDLSVKYPGGGLLSTVPDLLRFGQAVLENKLIQESSLASMILPADLKWQGTPYGLGWFVVNDPVYGKIIRHGGRQSGTNTYLSIFLDQQLVVAVMANDFNSAGPVYSLHQDLYGLILDPMKRNRLPIKIVALAKKDLRPYWGKYDFGKGQIMTISEKGGQLYTKMGKYPELPIYPEAKNQFFYRALDAQFIFELNEKGELIKTIYVQNGTSVFPKKIK